MTPVDAGSTREPLLFDALLFDLDGTLIATEGYWPHAAREGTRRAFAELGLQRAIPSSEEWMSLVGHPIGPGFEALFPDLDPRQRERVLELCMQEEHGAMRRHGVALLPGVEAALTELRRRGTRLGLASNCGRGYLDIALHELGLSRWIDEGRCLDSPGVSTKSDMVGDLLDAFDTRSAVMVGDRTTDRDAAWANGIPHVHLTRGYAAADEAVEAEATIDGMDELLPLLGRRRRWIEGEIEALAIPPAARALGVGGGAGSGKSLFARDLVRLLNERGRPARLVELESFRRPPGTGAADGAGQGRESMQPLDLDRFLVRTYDLDRLASELGRVGGDGPRREPLRVLEGAWLTHPRLYPRLDRLLWIGCPSGVAWRRLAGRAAGGDAAGALDRLATEILPLQAALEESHPARDRADRWVEGANALGPGLGPA